MRFHRLLCFINTSSIFIRISNCVDVSTCGSNIVVGFVFPFVFPFGSLIRDRRTGWIYTIKEDILTHIFVYSHSICIYLAILKVRK